MNSIHNAHAIDSTKVSSCIRQKPVKTSKIIFSVNIDFAVHLWGFKDKIPENLQGSNSILFFCTVKLRYLDVDWTIFTSSNYPKCKLICTSGLLDM